MSEEHFELSFNSMKVRLKHAFESYRVKMGKFQFHEGPIKTFVVFLKSRVIIVSIP